MNLVSRVAAPNLGWVADFTEFPASEGKLFLAGFRDLFHRGMVGWDTSDIQDTALAVSAFDHGARAHREPGRRDPSRRP